jgi:hypothetical protein
LKSFALPGTPAAGFRIVPIDTVARAEDRSVGHPISFLRVGVIDQITDGD